MRNASRVSVIGLLLIGMLWAAAPVSAVQRPALADQIARTYGADSWDQIEAIRYTFHIEQAHLSRSWIWEPKADRISYEGPDKDGKPFKVAYSRSQLASQSEAVKQMVDPAFINDQYALLFPLHLAWDTAATVEEAGKGKLHLGKGSARKLLVKYPTDAGGYTPADTWEVFLGKDGRLREITLRRAKGELAYVTWGDQKKAGPLLLSLDKRGTLGGNPIHIFYTDVAVKLMGSSTWIDAQ